MRDITLLFGIFGLITLLVVGGCGKEETPETASVESDKTVSDALSEEQIENIVRRSFQYVALYNVINKGAMDPNNPVMTGWNNCVVDTKLKDHNLKILSRPNNDSLYISCALDLRNDAMILDVPALDSKYVSLMAVGYDHYINVPMATRKGDFKKAEKVLFYTARTKGYKGESIDSVDRIFEASGDFCAVVFRVMPHASEPDKFKKIIKQMKMTKLTTLSEYKGGQAKPIDEVKFPAYSATDPDVFGTNLLEVMQFVFNHITFDPNDKMDQGILAAYKPLGIEPGKTYDATTVTPIDNKRFRAMAQKVEQESLELLNKGVFADFAPRILRPKGQTDLEAMVLVSVIGPMGLPMEEAAYPSVTTFDGKPMNAQHDYVVSMTKNQMPPAKAFWSLTLYDTANGFFIPNEHKKYSVGENAGMKLNDEGGIEIHVAAEKPQGVPIENWLPINRKDENLDLILRIYVPDLAKIKNWKAPKAVLVK